MTSPDDPDPVAGDPAPGPDPATAAQNAATRPDRTAWVSANAGSGKTSVLTRRVARLLLAGCRPGRILCLTYTRAAATEMQTRLVEMLGGWAMKPDAELAAALADLGEAGAPDAERLAEARRLFAQALETPGGLKIQTIHAFCASLLRRFPLEAGAPPDFGELDPRAEAAILDRLRDRMALAAERGEDDAFDALAARVPDKTLDDLSRAVRLKRGWFPPDGVARAAAALGVDPDADPAAAMRTALAGVQADEVEALADAMAKGGKGDEAWAEGVRMAVAPLRADDAAGALEALEAAVLTKKGAARSFHNFPTKAVRNAVPDIEPRIKALADAAIAARAIRAARHDFEATRDLHRFARALLDGLTAEKAARGALDFDDLVERALALLTRSPSADWALWKLDGGIDHILIDEAQDTSPEQWRLLSAIGAEFAAGAGARGDRPRTLFAVGDEKQSIYSFQGAAPEQFAEMRDHFRDRSGGALETHELRHSFRSAPAVLRAVDATFAPGPAAEDGSPAAPPAPGLGGGVVFGGAPPRHLAFHDRAPGRVEVWPPFAHLDAAPEPAWHEPVDAPGPAHPRARLVEAVADHLAALLSEGAPIPDRRKGAPPDAWRPMRPGDVLILLRKRADVAPMMIAALKKRGIATAGADRLRLSASLAVGDLLALLRATLDRSDDLAAAEALRSPFCGLSEDELFALAHDRGPRPLLQALADRSGEFPDAAALFDDLARAADFERPFELLQRVLVDHAGRTRLRARRTLGPEQEDAVDALLAEALACERAETPTLAGFLDWMDRGSEQELKRELSSEGAVRVMTVHGAKGLEAPFVILPDAGPTGARTEPLHPAAEADGAVALWSPGEETGAAAAAAREAAERRRDAEADRLLYVALTRAESRLLVCGALMKGREEAADSWRRRVAAGLSALGAAEVAPPEHLDDHDRAAPMLRLDDRWTEDRAAIASPAETPPAAVDPPGDADPPQDALDPGLPEADARAGPAPRAPGRVDASALGDDAAEVGAPSGPASPYDRPTARARGDAIHLLLELLPEVAEDDRPARADAILEAAHPRLPSALRDGCAAEALAALAMPEVAPFLAPGALAEAELAAELAPDRRLSGRVDRVIFGPDRVAVLDWKTGPPPASPEATPERYLRQMAAYRHAIARLHPGATVEAVLVWTAAPRADRLPDALLDAAFDRLRADALAPPAETAAAAEPDAGPATGSGDPPP